MQDLTKESASELKEIVFDIDCSEDESKFVEKRLLELFTKQMEKVYNMGREDGIEEQKQFTLNILDGIDIADKQMGNIGGGTEAIRFALKSRI